MKVVPTCTPVEFAAIYMFGEPMAIPESNEYLLVISDRFSKLVCTVTLKTVTAEFVLK